MRPHPLHWDALDPAEQGQRLARDAAVHLGSRPGLVGERSFPSDCSGFLAAVLLQNGIDAYAGATELQMRGNGVLLLHKFTSRYGRVFDDEPPSPGDLVFFSNTFDRNRNRLADDAFTHVGIVERVDRSGTVTFLHLMRNTVVRSVMNLSRPNRALASDGKLINSFLRRRSGNDPPGTRYLAGELFETFGSLTRTSP